MCPAMPSVFRSVLKTELGSPSALPTESQNSLAILNAAHCMKTRSVCRKLEGLGIKDWGRVPATRNCEEGTGTQAGVAVEKSCLPRGQALPKLVGSLVLQPPPPPLPDKLHSQRDRLKLTVPPRLEKQARASWVPQGLPGTREGLAEGTEQLQEGL